jgi:hypothetical protein
MFNNLLHVPLCITCHDHFNVRALVNDPVFKSVQDRNLIFVADGTDISHAYAKCLVMALDSHEMKQHSPGVQYVFVGERPLSDVFNTLKAGDVFVVTCVQDRMQDSQKRSICDRSPPFGSVVGAIGDPNRAPSSQGVRPTKWVFIRKEA